MLQITLVIVFAGLIGGLGNAYITDNGFIRPKTYTSGENISIWRPGVLGNVFVGGLAAFVVFALYGPLANAIFATATAADQPAIAFSDVGGAIVTGMGGARILSAEVDKRLLKAAGEAAAIRPQDPAMATEMRNATPAGALQAALK